MDNKYLYMLGVFISDTITRGILHPDITLDNIGIRSGHGLVYIDYADASTIDIRNELTSEKVRQWTESLFPIFDELSTYQEKSYLRAGLIAHGSLLIEILMKNGHNFGFSSFSFMQDVDIDLSEDWLPMNCIDKAEIADIIDEWNQTEKKHDYKHYTALENYFNCNERKRMSATNLFYYDQLYFLDAYFIIPKEHYPILYYYMAASAYENKRYCRAYGLFRKAAPLFKKGHYSFNTLLEKTKTYMIDIVLNGHITMECKQVIDKIYEDDYFQLLWHLDDLDYIYNTFQ